MLNIEHPVLDITVTESVCAFFAVCSTVYRLYLRRNRFGVDDAWAGFALFASIVHLASVLLHVHDPSAVPKQTKIAAYYFYGVTFYSIVWASRLSLLHSTVRIDPDPSRHRLYLCVSITFFLAMIALIAQLFVVCEMADGWKEMPSPQCRLDTSVAITQLVTDILADAFLLFAPLRVLSPLQDKHLRKRLIIIFSSCIITTLVSLVHAMYIITTGGNPVIISGLVENSVSLMVANAPVIVAAVLRRLDSRAGDEGVYMSASLETMTFVVPGSSDDSLKGEEDGSLKGEEESDGTVTAVSTRVGSGAKEG